MILMLLIPRSSQAREDRQGDNLELIKNLLISYPNMHSKAQRISQNNY